MKFYTVVILVVLLSFVSVLSADQTLRAASDSLNDVVILPAMLYLYRKLLTYEQQMQRQQRHLIKLLRWRKTFVHPCSSLLREQE